MYKKCYNLQKHNRTKQDERNRAKTKPPPPTLDM